MEDLTRIALGGLCVLDDGELEALCEALRPEALSWIAIGLAPARDSLLALARAEDLPRA
ncbi:MAG: hypothetical protein KDE22_11055 [Rhodobacterales bacterium]|nr:hypothetical protein [Rhodobacterales bacterium]